MAGADWLLKASLTRSQASDTAIDLGKKFVKSNQLVLIDTPLKKSTWNYGGKLYAAHVIAGKTSIFASYDLNLNYQQVIVVPLIISGAFSLLYLPPQWFSKFTIKIYEGQKMPLYLPDSNSVSASVANVTNVTVANNTTPISLLGTNNSRKRFSLRNKGNKAVLIGFSNNFNAGNAFLTLAAGAVYESDLAFTGEIFGLATAANLATDIAVIEFV